MVARFHGRRDVGTSCGDLTRPQFRFELSPDFNNLSVSILQLQIYETLSQFWIRSDIRYMHWHSHWNIMSNYKIAKPTLNAAQIMADLDSVNNCVRSHPHNPFLPTLLASCSLFSSLSPIQ
jgi:hypothetical protein